MNGLGFFIWQLSNMPAPDVLAQMLAKAGVKWVAIKVLDGPLLFNAKGGNQKLLKQYWAALKAAGVEPGGDQMVYGDQPGPEGDAASGFIQEFDPAFFLIDAEGAMKRFGANKIAKAYCDKLPRSAEVLLCSFRFPSQHGGLKPFPFKAYLEHEKVDGTMPQMYWALRHDPVEQLLQSEKEYKALTSKPFIPLGATFGEYFTVNGVKIWWEPTVAEIKSFVVAAKIYPAYGFYSLDYILRKNRMDWFRAATGIEDTPPPPPEINDHEKITRLWQYAQEQEWDV